MTDDEEAGGATTITDGIRALAVPGLDEASLTLAMLLTRLGRLNELLISSVLTEQSGDARPGLGEPWVLATLALRGAPYRASPTELCRISLLTSGGMTKTLRSLEAAGHIRRCPAPGDRRALLVELTDSGLAAARAMLRRISERYAPIAATAAGSLAPPSTLRTLLTGFEELLEKADSARWLRVASGTPVSEQGR